MTPLSEEPDESLMRRYQAGEEDTFALLLDRYAAHLINFAYRFLNSREDAEDIAQEVLLRVYRGKERYDPARPFRPWIFSIASRLVSNRLRNRKRRPQVSLDWKPEDGSDADTALDLPDKSYPLPEENLEKQQLARDVQKALETLPENQRTAVLLARFEEMSYEEIAQAMGSSVAAVKSLLFRARRSIITALTPYARGEK